VRQGEGIYVPQIFSPNEDGQNESFTVYGDPDLVQDVALLRIYDRWGELVFEQQSLTINDEAAGWQGTLRGRPVLPGVYVWYAEIRMRNGSIVFKKGELTVVR
jgi:gliding motility-associated-like protein